MFFANAQQIATFIDEGETIADKRFRFSVFSIATYLTLATIFFTIESFADTVPLYLNNTSVLFREIVMIGSHFNGVLLLVMTFLHVTIEVILGF